MVSGSVNTAIDRIERGIDGWRRNGARLIQTYYNALLAEAYAAVSKIPRSLEVIDEGLAKAHAHDERFFEAELWRLKAEYTAHSSPEEAERHARHAATIAEKQGARSLLLRALTSWAQLAGSTEVRENVQRRLKVLCATFTEGRDTPDFVAAKRIASMTD
jgi:predicted ATPase